MRDLYKFIGKGLSFNIIIEVIWLNLAWIVTLAVPMSVLVSCVMAFGNLSQDNEITALKACGISIYKIISPVIIVSTIIGFLTFEFNDKILPETNYRARLLMTDIHRKQPTIMLVENIFFDIVPNYRFLVKKVENKSPWVYDIIIFDQSNPDIQRSIVAEKGTIIFSKESSKLIVTLYDGEIHTLHLQNLENYQKLKFEKFAINLDVPGYELKRTYTENRGDREKSIKIMKNDIKNLENEINEQKRKNFNITGINNEKSLKKFKAIKDSLENEIKINMNLLTKSYSNNIDIKKNIEKLTTIINSINIEEEIFKSKLANKNRYEIEINKKYSIPVACVIFVLIGVPIGIMTRKGGILIGGGLSILLFTIYWAFLIAGESLGDRGDISPFWAMWSPNIFIGLVGIYLLIKVSKESPILSLNSLKKVMSLKKHLLK
jgi:lipopolysaccharide export system permease protein